MPYWDTSSTQPTDVQYLGGEGDPDNKWKVNDYSWQYSTQQFWVPAECEAEGDTYPICSLKRTAVLNQNPTITSELVGESMSSLSDFKAFAEWYSDVPMRELRSVSAYDP